MLAAPDFSRPIQIAVDAIASGAGAELPQNGPDDLSHPGFLRLSHPEGDPGHAPGLTAL